MAKEIAGNEINAEINGAVLDQSLKFASEAPALLLHKGFKVNAWNIKMPTHIWNFGGFGFKLFLSDYCPIFHLGAGDNERISNQYSSKPLLLADKTLEMRYLEYLRNGENW